MNKTPYGEYVRYNIFYGEVTCKAPNGSIIRVDEDSEEWKSMRAEMKLRETVEIKRQALRDCQKCNEFFKNCINDKSVQFMAAWYEPKTGPGYISLTMRRDNSQKIVFKSTSKFQIAAMAIHTMTGAPDLQTVTQDCWESVPYLGEYSTYISTLFSSL